MYAIQYDPLPLFRGLLEAIYVIPEQRGVNAYHLCELRDLDLPVREEEPLQRTWLRILMSEAVEAHIHIELTPVDTAKTESVVHALPLGGILKTGVPKLRLAVFLPALGFSVDVVGIKPYTCNLHIASLVKVFIPFVKNILAAVCYGFPDFA